MEFTLSNIAICYAVFAFAKFMLCMPHISRVIGIMSRLSGKERGALRTRYIFVVPVLLAATSFFGWVPALIKEGFGFFVIYPAFAVTRDCVAAYRAAHEAD